VFSGLLWGFMFCGVVVRLARGVWAVVSAVVGGGQTLSGGWLLLGT